LELLVVIALLALLAGILFPVFARARALARRTQCLSNLRQLAGAHLLYVQDWDEKLPPWILPGPARQGEPETSRAWTTFLQPYLRSHAILRDPDAPPVVATEQGPPYLADYSLLTWERAGRRGDPKDPAQRWPGPPLSLGHVVRPSETIQWMDGRTAATWSAGAFWRHGDGLNAAFVDGHAAWMTFQKFRRTSPDETGLYWLDYGSAHR
jgi:prepilin-type processing-associated H-X9-DG protein